MSYNSISENMYFWCSARLKYTSSHFQNKMNGKIIYNSNPRPCTKMLSAHFVHYEIDGAIGSSWFNWLTLLNRLDSTVEEEQVTGNFKLHLLWHWSQPQLWCQLGQWVLFWFSIFLFIQRVALIIMDKCITQRKLFPPKRFLKLSHHRTICYNGYFINMYLSKLKQRYPDFYFLIWVKLQNCIVRTTVSTIKWLQYANWHLWLKFVTFPWCVSSMINTQSVSEFLFQRISDPGNKKWTTSKMLNIKLKASSY